LLASRIGVPFARRTRSATLWRSAARSTTAYGGSRSCVAAASREKSAAGRRSDDDAERLGGLRSMGTRMVVPTYQVK
jgi:hypothetical protein